MCCRSSTVRVFRLARSPPAPAPSRPLARRLAVIPSATTSPAPTANPQRLGVVGGTACSYIGRRDEENFRQIVFDVQIVILKHVVLFRIEHFQQSRARIAAKICSQLVDFVEQQHRVYGSGLLHHLDDLSRQRADVGAAMAANFSFVTDAAQRQAHKLSARRARDRFAEAGLADSRRAQQSRESNLSDSSPTGARPDIRECDP